LGIKWKVSSLFIEELFCIKSGGKPGGTTANDNYFIIVGIVCQLAYLLIFLAEIPV